MRSGWAAASALASGGPHHHVANAERPGGAARRPSRRCRRTAARGPGSTTASTSPPSSGSGTAWCRTPRRTGPPSSRCTRRSRAGAASAPSWCRTGRCRRCSPTSARPQPRFGSSPIAPSCVTTLVVLGVVLVAALVAEEVVARPAVALGVGVGVRWRRTGPTSTPGSPSFGAVVPSNGSAWNMKPSTTSTPTADDPGEHGRRSSGSDAAQPSHADREHVPDDRPPRRCRPSSAGSGRGTGTAAGVGSRAARSPAGCPARGRHRRRTPGRSRRARHR